MTPKICVSVLPKNVNEALALIGKAEGAGADFVEVRFDCLEETRNLGDLAKGTKIPLIAANKLVSERGFFGGNEFERQQTLLAAAKSGFDYIDVDFLSPKCDETIRQLTGLSAKCILSYHKFDGVLATPDLEKILNEQIDSGANVCKIVLTAKQTQDNLPILNFISSAATKTKLVCFCMGEAGKTSRLLSPVFGAFFTFASLENGSETAPGQMSIAEMKSAFKLLGIRQ